MSYRIPPKIAVINSLAGYGRCSLTEALPIISAMKVQACPVPAAVFSNHTGFPTHYGMDFTQQMGGYLSQWDALDLNFDGIYCGFLGNKDQIPVAVDFIRSQKAKGCSTVLVDPVMGDHGKTYRTITASHCAALTELVRLADIITPNITEACLLTDTPWREGIWQEKDLARLCVILHDLGPKKIVITGIPCRIAQKDGFMNFISQRTVKNSHAETSCNITPIAGTSRHGTGDIFASIVAADAVTGYPFSSSVKKAADFISCCIRASDKLRIPEPEGVCFENFLNLLMEEKQ